VSNGSTYTVNLTNIKYMNNSRCCISHTSLASKFHFHRFSTHRSAEQYTRSGKWA